MQLPKAVFPPFYEPIKCGSLYSEHELTRTLTDGFGELLENVKLVDEATGKETKVFAQDRTMSNLKLSTHFIQAACGLAAFKAPFKTTPTIIVLILATIYMVGSLWQMFFDNFVADGLIASVSDKGVGASCTSRLSLYATFDRSKKIVRLALTPTKEVGLTLRSGAQRFRKFYGRSTWREIVTNILWSVVTRQRTANVAATTQATAELVPSSEEDRKVEGTWEWLSTPSHLRPAEQDAELKDAFRADTPSRKRAPDATPVGLVLERPITHYFDQSGLFMRDAAIEDLRNLFKRYYQNKKLE